MPTTTAAARSRRMSSRCGTKEMDHPCPIHLHAISSVPLTAASQPGAARLRPASPGHGTSPDPAHQPPSPFLAHHNPRCSGPSCRAVVHGSHSYRIAACHMHSSKWYMQNRGGVGRCRCTQPGRRGGRTAHAQQQEGRAPSFDATVLNGGGGAACSNAGVRCVL